MRKFLVSLSILFFVVALVQSQPKAKYVFYFIGDGMGLSQTYLTELYLGALEGKNQPGKLEMNKFPVTGFFTTYAHNRLITCSAAAGTALATGEKTSINTIGMNADRTRKFKSIAEQAHDNGFAVGIVTSVSPDHATPAVFYAHQPDRSMYYNIAVEMVNSGFEYFAGGGFRSPTGKNTSLVQADVRKTAVENGYALSYTLDEMKALAPGKKAIALSSSLAEDQALPYAIDADSGAINLTHFTAKGIELLYGSGKGFFMMVEGGKIDWACHRNDVGTTIHEVIDFDNALKEAIGFYKKHPDETLILVCADHETGGIALGYTGTAYELFPNRLKHQKISTEKFQATIDKIRNSLGSPMEKWAQMLDEIKVNFGLGSAEEGMQLTEKEMIDLKNAFSRSMKSGDEPGEIDQPIIMYGEYDPLVVAISKILSHKAGIEWSTFDHTGIPIPIRAIGVGQEKFTGFFDNTDVPKKILETMGLPYPN